MCIPIFMCVYVHVYVYVYAHAHAHMHGLYNLSGDLV